MHENFDGATLDSVREVSSSAVLNIVVHEEVTASSKDIPSSTVVHPHNIVVHTVPTTPLDGSVTPTCLITSVPDPIPVIPAFVADLVPVDSNIGTQLLLTDELLLTDDVVPAVVAIVSSLALTASSLATHEVGIVQHNNPRIQHDMKLPSLSSCQKRKFKETTIYRKPPYRTCFTREPSPSAQ